MPEARINQMARHVFHTAVVPIDGQPVFQFVVIGKTFTVVRVDIAQEIPRRTRPLGHGIRFTACIAAAFRAFAVYIAFNFCKRAFAVRTGFEILDLRQTERQFCIRHSDHTALLAVHNRNRLAPIALAVKRPVFHFILYAALADAFFGEDFNHFRNRILFVGHSV